LLPDGADPPQIPSFSVYPSEVYIYQYSTKPDEVTIYTISHANVSDFSLPQATHIWGDMTRKNLTTGEINYASGDYNIIAWSQTEGCKGIVFLPITPGGGVEAIALNNATSTLEIILIGNYDAEFEHKAVYPNYNSLAFWNSSNGDYYRVNWTSDGILNKKTANWGTQANTSIYSRPAQLPPQFTFTTETGSVNISSKHVSFDMSIVDADNNNDNATDTEYMYRIGNGVDWTDWADLLPIVDYSLSGSPTGALTITIEVKSMYGVAQQSLGINYTPSDDAILSYSGVLVFLVLIFSVSILLQQSKKLLLSEEGNILQEAILNGSKLDLNLNVLTLTAKENKS